jgi:hypothetical protein
LEIANFRIYVLPNTRIARADTHQGDLFSWAYELYNDRNWVSDKDSQDFTIRNRKISGDIVDYVFLNLEDFILEYCPVDTFVQSLTIDNDESIDYYNWGGLRFFLASYEEFLNFKRKESWDIEKILITRESVKETGNDYLSREHIWASNNRAHKFPLKYIQKRRLGNFVLLGLSSNIKLQDNDIIEKIEDLKSNSLISMMQVNELSNYLTKGISKADANRKRKNDYYFEDIAISLIDQRETALIKFALERWCVSNEKISKFKKVDFFETIKTGQSNSCYIMGKTEIG